MADITLIARKLIGISNKDLEKAKRLLKEEYGIEPKEVTKNFHKIRPGKLNKIIK